MWLATRASWEGRQADVKRRPLARREETTMQQQFKLDFRPDTYWPWLPSEAELLARIKGSVRRRTAAAVLETGGPVALDPSLFEASLSEEERVAVGQVHPALMGGEYLPDNRPTEIEIARIELASTMCDVISLRARRRGRRIAYDVVDEYNTVFAFRPATSAKPLTLRQLIRLIERIEVVEQPEAVWPEDAGKDAAINYVRPE
jgi:hypothetical protein